MYWLFAEEEINMMEQSRPLDALNRARNKRVIVDLKNQKQMIGNLVAFDIHINTVLENAEEYDAKTTKIVRQVDDKVREETTTTEMVLKKKLGTVFLRGDTIISISPS
jgi:small nuclear ribonucleoprotein (snRNP)-like protein